MVKAPSQLESSCVSIRAMNAEGFTSTKKPLWQIDCLNLMKKGE
jgi:hypothetical protein